MGPAAHHLVEYFVSFWFLELNHHCDPVEFCRRWRDMIEFALDAGWTTGRQWFHGHRMLRQLLAFGSEAALTRLPDPRQTVLSMRDLYCPWAEANLAVEEENVAALSTFLTSQAGAILRIDGLKWLGEVFKEGGGQYWRDRGGTGDALANLLDTALIEDAPVLAMDRDAREGLIALAAYLAARPVYAALALQERIKHLK